MKVRWRRKTGMGHTDLGRGQGVLVQRTKKGTGQNEHTLPALGQTEQTLTTLGVTEQESDSWPDQTDSVPDNGQDQADSICIIQLALFCL